MKVQAMFSNSRKILPYNSKKNLRMKNSGLYDSTKVIEVNCTGCSIFFLWELLRTPVSGVDPVREFRRIHPVRSWWHSGAHLPFVQSSRTLLPCILPLHSHQGRKGVGVGSANNNGSEKVAGLIQKYPCKPCWLAFLFLIQANEKLKGNEMFHEIQPNTEQVLWNLTTKLVMDGFRLKPV